MKITIKGQEYDFVVTGTLGLAYLAERALGCPLEDGNKYHTLMLYYCCLCASNRDKEMPDFVDFIASLTSAKLKELSEYFWQAWKELEGATPEDKEAPAGEG